MPYPEPPFEHPSDRLRIPVIDPREDPEEEPADERVMEMSYDEIGIVQLPVERGHTQHHSRQAGDQKLEEKSYAEKHRRLEAQLAAVHGAQPVEDLDPGRHGYQEGGGGEEDVAHRSHADGEHVVRPDAQADEGDHHHRRDHNRVSEDGLARKDRNDLREAGEGRNDQDVDFRMAEDPEEMLPQHRGAAGLRVEEARAEKAVQQKQDLRRR